jgi:hypothetical protein
MPFRWESAHLSRDYVLPATTTAGAAHLSNLGRFDKTMIDDISRQNWSTLLSPLLGPRIQRHERATMASFCAALAHSKLRLIDHERRHLAEEFPKNLLGLFRQCNLSKSTIHQAHPSISGGLIYMERRMPRAQAWMASLFDVSVRSPEPTDQEISGWITLRCHSDFVQGSRRRPHPFLPCANLPSTRTR